MPLYKATCSQCGKVFKARTRTALLSKVRKHLWKEHRNWMIRRIKQGKSRSKSNPSTQDFIEALRTAPRRAVDIYKTYTERQYQHIKVVMDAVEPFLPPEIASSWKVIEAIHDGYK